jgi:hypothetical protein
VPFPAKKSTHVMFSLQKHTREVFLLKEKFLFNMETSPILGHGLGYSQDVIERPDNH